ncbi:MAG: rlmD [Gammaproteobacteria bacterium]|jgi:23S rRNA (uracil1939-C5)-methyltransferase|nr:rlmD [Gammaproteobacteria bacterium]
MQNKQPQQAEITALSHEGRGIAHVNGKTVFIENALPGETVLFKYTYTKAKYAEGEAVEILKTSPERVSPKCQHYAYCGGCSMQHLASMAQITFKQQVLLEQLKHFGGITPQEVLAPILGDEWGYRHKARLGVRYVAKKGGALVGFREKNSRYLAELERCEVLHPAVGTLIPELKNLISSLEACQQIAQIEVAIGDQTVALVLRNLIELTTQDIAKLKVFAAQQGLWIYLQPKGPASTYKIWPEDGAEFLVYQLPISQAKSINYEFHPLDFTQVNPSINRQMVTKAIALLDLQSTDSVLDLFCGLGNFSLALAQYCQQVVGVEGDELMVKRAHHNAKLNHITNACFYTANLMEPIAEQPWMKQKYSKILLDPPRGGALEILPNLAQLQVDRIVYVSCNPATLARDAGILVNQLGYKLSKAGVMNMFPHTSHVESIALFER